MPPYQNPILDSLLAGMNMGLQIRRDRRETQAQANRDHLAQGRMSLQREQLGQSQARLELDEERLAQQREEWDMRKERWQLERPLLEIQAANAAELGQIQIENARVQQDTALLQQAGLQLRNEEARTQYEIKTTQLNQDYEGARSQLEALMRVDLSDLTSAERSRVIQGATKNLSSAHRMLIGGIAEGLFSDNAYIRANASDRLQEYATAEYANEKQFEKQQQAIYQQQMQSLTSRYNRSVQEANRAAENHAERFAPDALQTSLSDPEMPFVTSRSVEQVMMFTNRNTPQDQERLLQWATDGPSADEVANINNLPGGFGMKATSKSIQTAAGGALNWMKARDASMNNVEELNKRATELKTEIDALSYHRLMQGRGSQFPTSPGTAGQTPEQRAADQQAAIETTPEPPSAAPLQRPNLGVGTQGQPDPGVQPQLGSTLPPDAQAAPMSTPTPSAAPKNPEYVPPENNPYTQDAQHVREAALNRGIELIPGTSFTDQQKVAVLEMMSEMKNLGMDEMSREDKLQAWQMMLYALGHVPGKAPATTTEPAPSGKTNESKEEQSEPSPDPATNV